MNNKLNFDETKIQPPGRRAKLVFLLFVIPEIQL